MHDQHLRFPAAGPVEHALLKGRAFAQPNPRPRGDDERHRVIAQPGNAPLATPQSGRVPTPGLANEEVTSLARRLDRRGQYLAAIPPRLGDPLLRPIGVWRLLGRRLSPHRLVTRPQEPGAPVSALTGGVGLAGQAISGLNEGAVLERDGAGGCLQ